MSTIIYIYTCVKFSNNILEHIRYLFQCNVGLILFEELMRVDAPNSTIMDKGNMCITIQVFQDSNRDCEY